MITPVIERCAGIDVSKKFIAVCVMTGPADGEARSETRTFGTMVPELKGAEDEPQRIRTPLFSGMLALTIGLNHPLASYRLREFLGSAIARSGLRQ
jgi:hypothetical protein